MEAALTNLGNGRFKLRGRLDLSSVGRVLVAGRKLMGGFDSISIDLQQADCANTAGLALLVEWSTWSVAHDKVLRYQNPAGRLLDLIALNGVAELLNLPAQ